MRSFHEFMEADTVKDMRAKTAELEKLYKQEFHKSELNYFEATYIDGKDWERAWPFGDAKGSFPIKEIEMNLDVIAYYGPRFLTKEQIMKQPKGMKVHFPGK